MSSEEEKVTNHTKTAAPFSDFDRTRFMLLTTFKRDGSPAPTPVGTYKVADRLFLLTDPTSGKMKRIRRNPHVTVSPCALRGAPRGHTQHARVRVLGMEEAERIGRAFAEERPLRFYLERLLCDLRGKSLIFVEILPQDPPAARKQEEAA